MEFFIENPGFHYIAVKILANLDIQSLYDCREVNPSWKHFIDESRSLWQQVLKAKDHEGNTALHVLTMSLIGVEDDSHPFVNMEL